MGALAANDRFQCGFELLARSDRVGVGRVGGHEYSEVRGARSHRVEGEWMDWRSSVEAQGKEAPLLVQRVAKGSLTRS